MKKNLLYLIFLGLIFTPLVFGAVSGGGGGGGWVSPATSDLDMAEYDINDAGNLMLRNTTEEDIEGGRESLIKFKGEQSGGEVTTLATIQASHDGISDDEAGDLIFSTNDGTDGDAPTERFRINSSGIFTFLGEITSTNMRASTTGRDVQIGKYAGSSSTGYYETILGYSCMRYNEGHHVVGIGYDSAVYNAGDYLMALGSYSATRNRGEDCIGIGRNSIGYNLKNSAIGIGANSLLYNEGSTNIAIGENAFNAFNEDSSNAKTFSPADCDAATEEITITGHNFGSTGTFILLAVSTSDTLPDGLNVGKDLWEIKSVDVLECISDSFSDGGVGTHTVTPQYVYNNSTALGYNAEPDASNQVMLGDVNVVEIKTISSSPSVVLQNNTHEDTEGGRESLVRFKGEQSGGEETTLAMIKAAHDGGSDDEQGDLIFFVNDGADINSPTEAMRIDSSGRVGIGTINPGQSLHVEDSCMRLKSPDGSYSDCCVANDNSWACTGI